MVTTLCPGFSPTIIVRLRVPTTTFSTTILIIQSPAGRSILNVPPSKGISVPTLPSMLQICAIPEGITVAPSEYRAVTVMVPVSTGVDTGSGRCNSQWISLVI